MRFSICLALALMLLAGCSSSTDSDARLADGTSADALPPPKITADNDDELRQRIDEALTYTYLHRTLNLRDNAAWQILHGVLTYGTNFDVLNGDQPVDAIQWVLDGQPMTGWIARPGTENVEALLAGDHEGSGRQGLTLVMEPGTKTGQGHPDQWLAILTQCELPSDTKIVAGGLEFELGDVIRQAMWDIYDGKECSWTLISFTHYLPLDIQWVNSEGEVWDIERIMQMEADEDINASACGGTHRLIGMTMALRRYRASLDDPGAELTGGWAAAEEVINRHKLIARQYQNPNGAFSTNYFSRPAFTPELSEQIGTTGHTLEFLSLALPKERLEEAWVERAAFHLCDLFEQTEPLPLECGKLYHAAHGLMEYREKRWGPWPYPEPEGDKTAAAE